MFSVSDKVTFQTLQKQIDLCNGSRMVVCCRVLGVEYWIGYSVALFYSLFVLGIIVC